jgi:small subunit ribosomal protein S4
MGFAKSPRIARQLISHGHILINGRKTTVPSRTIKKGDIVEIKEASKKRKPFEELDTHLKQYTPPTWLKVDAIHKKGECLKEPEIDTAALPFDPSLIGEFYAR